MKKKYTLSNRRHVWQARTLYFIADWTGWTYAHTARATRRECINEFVRELAQHVNPDNIETWAELKAQGYQCVKANVQYDAIAASRKARK